MNYFEIPNGPTYPRQVKDLWVRGEVYDEFVVEAEERNDIENGKSLKGKSRVKMGLKEFKDQGIEISITQDNIAQLIGVENQRIMNLNSKYGMTCDLGIKDDLFENQNDYGKVKNLDLKFILLFKIFIVLIIFHWIVNTLYGF